MFRKLMANFRKPEGILGGWIAGMMNWGHGPMTREVVKRLDIAADDVVLDVGCGGGGAIALMAAAGAQVYGIDYSDASVRKSLAKNQAAVRNGRVRVEKGDVRSLPYPEETFTLVTAFETVFFWEDIQDCFARIRSVLKPGGRFALAVEAWKREDGTINCPDVFLRNLDMTMRSADEFVELLRRAGFSGITPILDERGKWLCVVAERPLADESPFPNKILPESA